MSQTSAPPTVFSTEQSETDSTPVRDEEAVQLILGTLGDEDCRTILALLSDDVLSAKEISNRCGLALSTTYRKLDSLSEVGLLDERSRLGRSGRHASEYARAVTDVLISFDIRGRIQLQVTHRDSGGDPTTVVSSYRPAESPN